MEPDKPFKTIEVIDSKTSQICKVACMSCIRGHRTTSCGIPVCRSKVFWTVKRPGRPSNSCTCRYGTTGGCKCVVARTACPHKSKKGEKRSGECRCDEQGRYCCLLEPEHWKALMALRKPTVDFFPTREALEARQTVTATPQMLRTPSYTVESPNSPLNGGLAGMSSPLLHHSRVASSTVPPAPLQPLKTALTPRFGLMGIGAPQGLPDLSPPDVLTWQGEAPPAPREYHLQPMDHYSPPEQSSCCQGSASASMDGQSNSFSLGNPFEQHALAAYGATDAAFANAAALPLHQPAPAPIFDFQYEYFRFPSAICQSCGLSGCNCKNCPPIFQNFGTTSWAQCCGRKHARDSTRSPPSLSVRNDTREQMHKVPRLRVEHAAVTEQMQQAALATAAEHNTVPISPAATADYTDLDVAAVAALRPELELYDHLMGAQPLNIPGTPDALEDISAFLLSDLNQSEQQQQQLQPEVRRSCCGGAS